MPRKKSFTGNLFAADDKLFDDTEESSELKPEEPDLPVPPEQTNLAEETDQRDTEKTEQTKNTGNTYSTDKENQTQETHSSALTINPPSAGKQKETKSKRLNLLIRPSLLKEFAKIAYMQQTSVNDLINQLIAEHVGKKSETIAEYDRLFKDRNA
ncbi:MAG TPA: hypothetical protein ENL07_07990 [Chlorobaculum parvum]|uniref:Uncharacterized protein n=1 Tax=Chlorobaculum parvum TaxID=274539 RepID=A0A7C5DES9_9CHLB|nr:hypothetical protein [Chlorobaculum parvum]